MGGTVLALAAAGVASGAMVQAPTNVAALAQANARAIVASVSMPRGAERVRAPAVAPPTLGFAQGYVTVATVSRYWSVPAARVQGLLGWGGRRSTSSWSSNTPPGAQGRQYLLAPRRWLALRWLILAARPAGHGRWLVLVQASVVWEPNRLELPDGVSTVVITRLSDGSTLANVTAPAQVAQIVADVNGLIVDEAVNAVWACPSNQPPGFALSFEDASGELLASAQTVACPADLELTEGSQTQPLVLGDLQTRLQKLVGVHLP